jgi:DNA-binding NarL/FixJ family response regulator
MTTSPTTQVLIADDSALVRQGIKQFLALAPDLHVCGEAADGPEALRKSRELSPDLILLDISMPGQNGLQTARLIVQERPSVHIIVMSQHDPAHLLPRAIEAGALACIDKSRLATDLLPAIAALSLNPQKSRGAASA